MKSKATRHIDAEVRMLMDQYGVSYRTGFLAEDPLRVLPSFTDNTARDREFVLLDQSAYMLTLDIAHKNVVRSVEQMKVPAWCYDELSEPIQYRLMLVYAMRTHAYFHELLGYRNIGELMQDDRIKSLPPQLAVPLWELSKITGIAPSMSYCLYSLSNYFLKDPNKKIGLGNIDLIHSFTSTLDEKWFVWIHQVMECVFAPAIPALVKAYLLSMLPFEDIPSEVMTRCLTQAARASAKTVDILEQMRNHCDYHTYFDRVRLFYGFPRSVVFEGVDELNGEKQEVLGETGGHTPLQHSRLMVLGMDHEDIPYFPQMRKHMPAKFRNLIELMACSRIREYVMWARDRNNVKPARPYNQLVWSVIAHRWEHLTLVKDYITTYGETHGTGKPPLDWLEILYERTKQYLIW